MLLWECKRTETQNFVVCPPFQIFLLEEACSATSIDPNIFMYASGIRISIYIHSEGWVHKYPSRTACSYEFLPCFSLHLFHHLGYSSMCPSVCPHYTRMTREELANLRITGDMKGVEGRCLPSRPFPYLLFILTIFISLVVAPPTPFSFFLFLLFFGASFLFHLVPTTKRRILSKKVDFEVLYPSSFAPLSSRVP